MLQMAPGMRKRGLLPAQDRKACGADDLMPLLLGASQAGMYMRFFWDHGFQSSQALQRELSGMQGLIWRQR